MGDEARIHVEPGAAAGRGDWPGPGPSSRRVVHEPTRRGRVAAVVVLAGLVVGGLALSLGGSGADDRPDEPPQEMSARDAYLVAIGGLGRARTFAYHSTVRAAEPSQLRPGMWLAGEVTLEGAVLLPHSITREVATVVDDDRVVETITSGATVWSRTAASSSGLDDLHRYRPTRPGPDAAVAAATSSGYTYADLGPRRPGLAACRSTPPIKSSTTGTRIRRYRHWPPAEFSTVANLMVGDEDDPVPPAWCSASTKPSECSKPSRTPAWSYDRPAQRPVYKTSWPR